LQLRFIGLNILPAWVVFMIALVAWTIIFIPITGWINKLTVKRPWWLLVYTLIGIPFIFALAESFVRNEWNTLVQRLILFPIFSLLFLTLEVILVVITSGSIPEALFLFITSVRAGRGGDVFPSYETLANHIITELDVTTRQYTDKQIRHIEAITQQKQNGLGVRTQTVGLVFAILALVGLLQLTLAQGEIAQGIDNSYTSLLAFIGLSENVPSGSNGVILVGILLLGLVISGLRYSARAYLELRLLEVIGIFCVLRSKDETPSSTPSSIIYKRRSAAAICRIE
jgi:hypothetical protein